MRLPRFARRWAVRVDHGYEAVGKSIGNPTPIGKIAVALGPYTDKSFRRRSSAERHIDKMKASGVPAARVRLYRLGWSRVEEES